MLRSAASLLLAFALGLLPAVHDVCGPDCSMDVSAAAVMTAGAPGAPVGSVAGEAECPLHAADHEAPANEADGCTHDHGAVREAPDSTSAVAPSATQPLAPGVAAFAPAGSIATSIRTTDTAAPPPADRSPQPIVLRI